MKGKFEKHEVFLMALIFAALGLLFLAYKRTGLGGAVGPLGWVLLGVVVYTEVMQMFYDEQITMSLSGPVLVFAIYSQPFWFVLLLVLVCTTAGKVFQTYYYHEQERVFDIKLVFNLTQYMVMAAVVQLLFSNAMVSAGFLRWTLASILYTGLNIILTGTVVTLYQGSNGFLAYRSKSVLLFVYFHAAITTLLAYVYDFGSLLGCLLVFLVLIPMQGEILQRASIHKLNPQLVQDELTGAFNRSFMKRKITEWLHHQKHFALLFMDLDDFKKINDTYGHIIGDEILIHFVEGIRRDLRQADRIFRFGGDEFCVLFEKLEDAEKVHKRWKDEWMKFESADGTVISYTFSSGVVAYQDDEEMNYYELLDQVDRQMYLEKKNKMQAQSIEIS